MESASSESEPSCTPKEPPKKRKFASIKRKKRKAPSRNKKGTRLITEIYVNQGEAIAGTANNSTGVSARPTEIDLGRPSSAFTQSPVDERNVSITKLMNASFDSITKEGAVTRSSAVNFGLKKPAKNQKSAGNCIFDKGLMMACLNKAAMCRKCRSTKGRLELRMASSDGLAEHLSIVCSNCKAEQNMETSKKLEASERVDGRGGKLGYDVNRRAVIASLGMGHAGLKQFCGFMNLLPPITNKAYNNSMKAIEKSSLKIAERLMNEAAGRLKAIMEIENGNEIELVEGHVKIARVAVTVDGTWQKRGYSSRHGVVFVMSVRTGEVLDFEVLSKVCFECRSYEKIDKNTDKYLSWWEAHKNSCSINHVGASGEMESKGAAQIFLRSIEKRGLKYSVMVGDGDTGCFGNVCQALKRQFGDNYVVVKEECVGHVQKRMGTSLRELKRRSRGKKLADGKGIGDAGRLTDKAIDSMQNYYGNAIRRNKGDLAAMKDAIKAIYKHMIRDDTSSLEDQHSCCPKEMSTWCKYWKDQLENTTEYNDQKRLPPVFKDELKPIFNRLSDEALLKRCLMGVTQNQNEALHGVLWQLCPKTIFCGKRRITIGACQAMAKFNVGASSLAEIIISCNISPGHNTLRALRDHDATRLKSAAVKVSEKYKRRRRYLRAQRLKKATDKQVYVAGGFGLTSTPESYAKKRKVTAQTNQRSKKPTEQIPNQDDLNEKIIEPSIVFMMPLEEIKN